MAGLTHSDSPESSDAPPGGDDFPVPPPASQELTLHRRVRRLDWGLVGDALLAFFSMESLFVRTLRDFVMRPRTAFERYLGADRLRYSNPLKLVITLVAISTFLNYWGGTFDTMVEGFAEGVEHASPERGSAQEQEEALAQFLQQNYNLLILGGIPALAFATWFLYRKRAYNFIEHLALNSFIFSVTSVLYVLLFIPTILFPVTGLVYTSFALGYQAWVYRTVMGRGWGRALTAVVLSTLIYVVIVAVAVGIYANVQLRAGG